MLQGIEASAAIVPVASHRRRHRRADLCFKVQFRILPEDETLQTIDNLESNDILFIEGDGYTQNVSLGGLGFCGELGLLRGQSLKKGDFLKIEIYPPNTQSAIRCIGTVAWIKIDRNAQVFWAGAFFLAVKHEDLERMQMEAQEKRLRYI